MRKWIVFLFLIPFLVVAGERYRLPYETAPKEFCPNCSIRLFQELEKINTSLAKSVENEKKMASNLEEISQIIQQYRLYSYGN